MRTIINDDEMLIKVSDGFIENANTPDSKPLSEYILNQTKDKFKLYRKIFQIKKLEKISFEIYDDLEEWKEVYRKRFDEEPPEYSRGSFDTKTNLSFCVQHSNPKYATSWWYFAICTNAHEAFHLFYKKYIYGENRIVWFDEGLAQYISGENDDWINDEEVFKNKYLDFFNKFKPISNLNERVQGNTSVPDDIIFSREGIFDGYMASLFSITYLVENYGENYLFEVMKDNNKILELGYTILDDMTDFYNKKYIIKKLKMNNNIDFL